MNKKILSMILSTAVIFSTFTGCDAMKNNLKLTNSDNNTSAEATEPEKPAPYYSVTNAYVNHEKNFYYELDVRIPVIEYFNEETDALIDPINKEIYTSIMSLVEKSTIDAYDTYVTYLESAKANYIADREKKLNELKLKYKSIMGPDEVKALANFLSEKIDIHATDSEVEGFVTSQDIIGIGPHNKNIIIPNETISSSITQTTMAVEGRPGKKGIANQNIMPQENTKKTFASRSNLTRETKMQEVMETQTTNAKATKEIDIAPAENKLPPIEKGFKRASLSQYKDIDIFRRPPRSTDSEIIDYVDITVENFYKELSRIERTRIPGKRELTWQFIPTYICYDFDVKCLDDEYLSLLINIKEERVSTKTRRLYYNIDLKNKKLVTLKELKGDDYVGDENAFFINNNHEPVILLDKYAITE